MRPRLRTGTGRRAAGRPRPCAMPTLTGQGGSVSAGGGEAPSPQPSPARGGGSKMLRPTRQAGKMLRCSARQAGKSCAVGQKDAAPPSQPDHPSPLAGEGPGERGGHRPLRRPHPRRCPPRLYRDGCRRAPRPGQTKISPLRRQGRPTGGPGRRVDGRL